MKHADTVGVLYGSTLAVLLLAGRKPTPLTRRYHLWFQFIWERSRRARAALVNLLEKGGPAAAAAASALGSLSGVRDRSWKWIKAFLSSDPRAQYKRIGRARERWRRWGFVRGFTPLVRRSEQSPSLSFASLLFSASDFFLFFLCFSLSFYSSYILYIYSSTALSYRAAERESAGFLRKRIRRREERESERRHRRWLSRFQRFRLPRTVQFTVACFLFI